MHLELCYLKQTKLVNISNRHLQRRLPVSLGSVVHTWLASWDGSCNVSDESRLGERVFVSLIASLFSSFRTSAFATSLPV